MRIIDLISTDGYVDLGVYEPKKSILEVAAQVAPCLGVRVPTNFEQLRVNSTIAKLENTYGGNYGYRELPLHTDLAHWYVPPRYLMLRCAIGDPEVSTLLLHHRYAVAQFPDSVVSRALFRPRRRLEGKLFLMRLRHNGIFRWDSLFLAPENDEAWQVRDLITGRHPPFKLTEITLAERGRTIVIDNWKMLHGRSSVKRIPSKRRIDRCYFAEEN